MNLRSVVTSFLGFLGGANPEKYCSPPCVPGDESIMKPKEHGTSHTPVQPNLRWNCDNTLADRICNFNRHYAENSGYFEENDISFLSEVKKMENPEKFYDSNTGKLLFTAPSGRTWKEFLEESHRHGWPSFRDDEVNWDVVRILPNGETVSIDGTHLGHNLPDKAGNRLCINLVSIAGNPSSSVVD
eukprot:CAMPEP_0194167238 /NCGR_PEP_ID=MMETSP0154-20130528/2581_1 /TAXON_ID=1049557 /ORGANISM="Thalassiothrix antarctica, Strain L6-D1" /LENGTH=185 /DNA_ID=CAMNT_0038878093 /DNA_START=39 /DNA_END=596 /DNA_ORIENTATION=+